MADYLNDPSLQAARNTANTAQQNYYGAQQASYTLPDLLKQALTTKFNEASNPLMADINTARQRVYTDMSNAPLQVMQPQTGVIFSPNQQAALIDKYRAPGIANLAGLMDRYNLETGGLQNIINSTANAFQAQTAGLQGKAETARQSYTDLLGLMQAQTEEDWRQKQFAEEQRQFNETQKAKTAGDNSLLEILTAIMAAQEETGKETGEKGDKYLEEKKEPEKAKEEPLNLAPLGTDSGGLGMNPAGYVIGGNNVLYTNPQNALPQEEKKKKEESYLSTYKLPWL